MITNLSFEKVNEFSLDLLNAWIPITLNVSIDLRADYLKSDKWLWA